MPLESIDLSLMICAKHGHLPQPADLSDTILLEIAALKATSSLRDVPLLYEVACVIPTAIQKIPRETYWTH